LELSGHLAVWIGAVALSALASPLVRAYADYLERGPKERAEKLAARVIAAVRASAPASVSPRVIEAPVDAPAPSEGGKPDVPEAGEGTT
jgi:hypothetical protein